ncbi:MAG: tetratricopeptide repeat-containing sensor histidine kinase [Bacteroidales bacterium]|nr:tetratricopeptide repeat-containing sensor histidine kinase [Bacteroidales bacterium]
MKKARVILLLFIISFSVFAQNAKVDSLESLLANHLKPDTIRINLLNDIAGELKYTDIDKTLLYATQADSLSDVLGFKKGKSVSLKLIGNYYFNKHDYTQSLAFYQKALKNCEVIGDKAGISYCYNYTGNIYLSQGDYSNALEYYLKALKFFEEIDDKTGTSGVYNNIGNIYYAQGDYPRTLEYFQKALKVFEELNNKTGMSGSYNNIGVVYDEQGDYPKALEYYQQSLKIREELNDKYGISDTYTNIGNIYYVQKDYSKAMEYFQKSMKINTELNYSSGLSISYLNMGIIYLSLEDYSKSLECLQKSMVIAKEIGSQDIVTTVNIEFCNAYFKLENYKRAIQYGEKGFYSAIESGERDNMKKAADILAKCYAAIGNYKKAYQYHIEYKAQSDSLFNESNIEEITNLANQYKFEKEKGAMAAEQAQKDAIHIAELKYQKVIKNSFIVGFLFMVLFAVTIIRNLVQKRKANLLLTTQKAEIVAQKEKINSQYLQLEKLDKFKEMLTHALVHDLKNPLSQILLNTRDHKVNLLARKMLRLITNMLDVEKYEKAGFNLNNEILSLRNIITEVINGQETGLREKNLEVQLHFTDFKIRADKEVMVRIFDNLLSNAVRYSPLNRSIDIIAEPSGDGMLHISMKNYGDAIPEEALPYIFDKYRHFGKSEGSAHRSTGLGLTFCKMAVEAHGGKIGARNDADEGCKFWFTMHHISQSVKQEENETILPDLKPKLILTKTEKEDLKEVVKKMKEFKIFEISRFRYVLDPLKGTNESNVNEWISRLISAINIQNEAEYNRLINLIENEEAKNPDR